MEYILFLLPAILATGIYEKMFEEELTIKDFIYSIVIYTIAINFICFVVICNVLKRSSEAISTLFVGSFVEKYLLLSVFLAVVLPLVFKYIKETFRIRISVIEVNGNKKDENKKAKSKKHS